MKYLNRLQSFLNIGAAIVASTIFLAATSHASVLWSCTSPSSFKSLEEQDVDGNYGSTNGSSCTVVTDATQGSVIKFHKVSNDRRCEGKGADNVTITKGSTYYIGWRFKLSNTVNNNSIFQWKAYGSPMVQNYPIVLKMISGKLTLEHYKSGGTRVTLWSHGISANTWYYVTLKIKVSDQDTGGNLQFWFGGDSTPDTLLTGGTSYTCKTFDGSSIEPKWGIYGAEGSTVDSYVDQLKIGTTYGDVDP